MRNGNGDALSRTQPRGTGPDRPRLAPSSPPCCRCRCLCHSLALSALAVVSNRTFLVLYRLLYYKHLLLRLSSEERPAALSTYFEAWFAYKEFFDLALGLDGSTAAAELVLPSPWVHDIIFDFVYFHERFVRRRVAIAGGPAAVAGGGFGGDGEDSALAHGEGGEDNSTRAFGLSPAASIVQAAGTQVSEEELAQVWLVSARPRAASRVRGADAKYPARAAVAHSRRVRRRRRSTPPHASARRDASSSRPFLCPRSCPTCCACCTA